MKIYQKPETVNVNIEGADLMAGTQPSLPPGGPGSVDENQGMAPRKIV